MAARCCAGLLLLAWAGCGNDNGGLGVETDEPLYREGQQLEKQGRTKEALAAYLRLISQRGDDAPQSHLEVGVIELQDIKDPIAAIYHFRRFRELEPNSPMAPRVIEQIQRAERDFASTLPAPGMGADLSERVVQLEGENERLKAELAMRGGLVNPPRPASGATPSFTPAMESAPLVPLAEPAPAPGPAAATQTAVAPPPAHKGRTHVVAKKDTLYNLAVRYYGSGGKWKDILNANRDKLGPGEHPSLVVGTELKIP